MLPLASTHQIHLVFVISEAALWVFLLLIIYTQAGFYQTQRKWNMAVYTEVGFSPGLIERGFKLSLETPGLLKRRDSYLVLRDGLICFCLCKKLLFRVLSAECSTLF